MADDIEDLDSEDQDDENVDEEELDDDEGEDSDLEDETKDVKVEDLDKITDPEKLREIGKKALTMKQKFYGRAKRNF
jgi:hypothetical protein